MKLVRDMVWYKYFFELDHMVLKHRIDKSKIEIIASWTNKETNIPRPANDDFISDITHMDAIKNFR